MANGDYFPVFIETSLHTRLVTSVSYEDTAASLKRKIEDEHAVSFPDIGAITVQAVKTCREGVMYQLADSMPVSTVLSGVSGTLLLYVDAATDNYERMLRNGRADQEVNVPIGGRSEDLVVIKAPSIDKDVLVDPLHDSTEAASHLLNKTKKKKHKKNLSSEDTALRLEELREREVKGFEGNPVQEEPGQTLQNGHYGAHAGEINKRGSRKGDWNVSEGESGEDYNKRKRQKKAKVPDQSKDASGSIGEPLSMKEIAHEASWEKERNMSGKILGQDCDSPQIPDSVNLMEPIIPNPVEYTPTEVITSTTVNPSSNEEASGAKHNARAKGDVNFHGQPDGNQMLDQGTELSGDPTKEPSQSISNYGVAKLGEEQARRDDAKKGRSLQEATQMIDAVSGGVTREEKEHKKTKGFSSDVACEIPPIKENEPQVKDNIHFSEKKDSKMAEKPAQELKHDTHTSGMDEAVKEKSRKKHKTTKGPSSDTPFEVPPIRGDESEKADDKVHESNRLVDEETNFDLPLKSAEELKQDTNISGMDEAVKEKSRKKHKKTKGPSSETPCEVPPRGNESEKADDKVHKSNQLVDEEGNFDLPLKSAEELKQDTHTSGMDETVKEKSRKKHKKTKGPSSDTPCEVPPIRRDESEKADDKVHKSNRLVDEGNSDLLLKSAEELKQDTHTSGMDEAVKEKSRKKHKKTKGPSSDTPCEVPPIRRDESEKADDKVHKSNRLVDEERNSNLPLKSAEELKHDTCTNGMDELVKEKSRKRHKKTKGPSSDISCEVPPIRGDESEKADDKVYEGNRLVDNKRNFEIPLKSAVGDGAEADNSVPCKLDKERLQPEIISPADKEIGFLNHLRQEDSMGDKEELRNEMGFSKEAAHVTGGDPGVISVENKSHKKKKAASIEGLVEEARGSKSGPERVNDAILEKKTSSDAVDRGLINITGRDTGVLSVEKRHKNNKADTDGRGKKQSTEKENGSCKEIESNLNIEKEIRKEAGDAINSAVEDPVVASIEKRKHKKTKPAAIDALSQGQSSIKNDSSKERKSSLLIEKEASNEAGDAHVTKNSGDVDFPAPNCADPDDSMNKIVSGVLADLKERSSIPPDTQVSKDAAPAMLLLAEVAVDQHKAEQASGVVVKIRKEKSDKGKTKEKGVSDKHGVMSLVEGTTENAPTTPEKVQKSVDNFSAENQDKEAFSEGIQTSPTTEKMDSLDLSLPKPTKKPSDATSPLKGTKVNKKIQNSTFSKDDSKFHTSLSNNVSKRDDKMKRSVADMAVMSDASTEDDEEVKSRLIRPVLTVRKASNKRLDEKIDASRKNSAVFSSGTIFDDSASEASTRDESGSAYRGSPMPVKKQGRAMMSPGSHWKDEGVAEDDLPMSQEPTKPKKKVNLSSVLMSSSCYKKAKVSACQSQAEDRDMIDVVFETQPDGFLKLT